MLPGVSPISAVTTACSATGPSAASRGYCLPALRPACDDNNPCTIDVCNEASKACTHTLTAPADVDGDGHFAIACGSDADDCDDNNPDVYPGHAEICDGVDNNCNGIVDEGVWKSGVVKILSPVDAGVRAITPATLTTQPTWARPR